MHSPFWHTALPQTTIKWAAVRSSFGCVLLLNQIYLTTVPFDNTTPIYLISLLNYIFYIMLLIVWVHSFSKILPYVKFTEDKVLIFVVLCEQCEDSATVSPNPNFQSRLIR